MPTLGNMRHKVKSPTLSLPATDPSTIAADEREAAESMVNRSVSTEDTKIMRLVRRAGKRAQI